MCTECLLAVLKSQTAHCDVATQRSEHKHSRYLGQIDTSGVL